VETGDVQGLLDILAPDVVLMGDGGGVKQAVLRPISGAERVARMLVVGRRKVTGWTIESARVNGHPALVLRVDGEIDTVMAVRLENGRIAGLYAVRNPAKLSHMDSETALRR
jgi:RNA polymerase sigma-70 factor (ECF subfamily)